MFNLDFKGKRLRNEIAALLSEVPELPQTDKDNILMFLENGEWGMAFDSFCSQVYENDIVISGQLYARIEEIGLKMEMENSTWKFLKELIK